jgi:peptide/nickel transport system permease protein
MADSLSVVSERSSVPQVGVAQPGGIMSSESRRTLKRLLNSRGIVLGGVVLLAIIFVALAAPLLAPYDPLVQHPDQSLDAPTLEHPMGTDLLGRDVLSRVIVGSRQSLMVAIVAITIAASIGIVVGLVSGFYEGWIDLLLQRLIEIQLAFPGLLLALAIVAIIGPGLGNAMIAVGISLVPSYARMVRASVLTLKHNAYIEAARVIGCRDARLIAVHILPNVAVPILVLTTVGIAWAILIGSSLSFLGLGAQPPFAEWGRDLSEGRNYMAVAWWVSTFPGLAILFTIISVNLLGDGLRDTLDPRLRQQ